MSQSTNDQSGRTKVDQMWGNKTMSSSRFVNQKHERTELNSPNIHYKRTDNATGIRAKYPPQQQSQTCEMSTNEEKSVSHTNTKTFMDSSYIDLTEQNHAVRETSEINESNGSNVNNGQEEIRATDTTELDKIENDHTQKNIFLGSGRASEGI